MKDQEMPNRLPSRLSNRLIMSNRQIAKQINNVIVRKKKIVVLLTDSILKTLSMGKFNSCFNGANVQLNSFSRCKMMMIHRKERELVS